MRGIQSGARHLLSVIDNIVGYSQAQAGAEEIDREPVDLGELVEECVELVRPRARAKGIDLRAVVPDGVPEARSDSGKIRQILLNLAGNAVKFTEGGACGWSWSTSPDRRRWRYAPGTRDRG